VAAGGGVTRRRVLLVSYHFPPVGGAGVQRPAKLARYLPDFGWDVSVLQAANPSAPLLDPSLLAEIPPATVHVRARTLEPGYAAKARVGSGGGASGGGIAGGLRRLVRRAATLALQPDAQVLWLPAARREGLAVLRRLPHDAILATAPTYTNLVLGGMLARATGVPLVSDYRDEWDLSSAYWENAPRDPISHRIQGAMQRRVLRRSAAVVATTEASTARLAVRAAEAGAAPRMQCIYNGWDAHDLAAAGEAAPVPRPTPARFRLAYTGTLWNLTSIAPLAAAVEQLATTHPDLTARLELVALGRKTPEQETELARIAATPALVTAAPYAEHPVALATMRDADALLLLLSDVPGAERVAPAKLFEYLAVARPMLAITPEGETAGIVRASLPDGWRAPTDVAGIATWLAARLTAWPAVLPVDRPDPAVAARFERRALAGQMAALLDAVTVGGG
jgi:hypothetical protein